MEMSRVAIISQFHHSTKGIYVEAVDNYSQEAFVTPKFDLGDNILPILA